MRILLISNLLYPDGAGGAERYVAELASELRREHEVRVFTGSPGGEDVITTQRYRRLPAGAPTPSKILWHLRDQWHPGIARDIRNVLRTFKPQVVHSHEIQGLSAAVFAPLARAGVPHVHTAHDFNLLCVRTTMTVDGSACDGRCALCQVQRAVRTRAVQARLDWLVAPSQFVLDRHLRVLRLPRERASRVPYGTSPAPGRRRGDGGPIVYGFIGTLSPHKGVHTLLRAFQGSSCDRLEVAGSGVIEGEAKAAAEADRRIHYWGRVDGARREAFFDAIDVLVVPSEWEENAPLVTLEAAVRGIPTVVTARGGLPETPEAMVVSAHDQDALLLALHTYSESPARVSAASARLLALKEGFSWTTHLSRLTEIYRRVADRLALGAAA